LRTQAPIGAVVDVAGNEERVNVAVDAKVDDAFEGIERRGCRELANAVVDPPQPAERAVEVEVGGVDEPERLHGQNSFICIST
jgi:hypothetical protein